MPVMAPSASALLRTPLSIKLSHDRRNPKSGLDLQQLFTSSPIIQPQWLPGVTRVSSRRSLPLKSPGRRKESAFGAPASSAFVPCAVASRQIIANDTEADLAAVAAELAAESDARKRTRLLLALGHQLPKLNESDRVRENRVMGCASQVWVTVAMDSASLVHVQADSDSKLSRGLCAILTRALSGRTAEEILSLAPTSLRPVIQALGSALQQPSRINGLHGILQFVQKRTRAILEPSDVDPFPSLLISSDGSIHPQGDFARAQAQYLQPDSGAVTRLAALLSEKKLGVVAHFYMDPEVQGVLVAAQRSGAHIHISDSLAMADSALKMAAEGCERIAVLGVDFMAENVRAILDRGGYPHIPVYRMASEDIGCSLAEAALSDTYLEYLSEAGNRPRSLHVIYINTSLETKARAQALLPTITCTSSNVLQTVLQAFAQVPDLTLWYGPDTYMGGNLAEMLRQMAQMSDEAITAVHPDHNRTSITALLPRLHYYMEGSCMVHDLFGRDVVLRTRQRYGDAYLTAHFEVPGDMFGLAMEARARGMGTVGSTQTILDFIEARTGEALGRGFDERLRFVLGTEAGMITAIVQKVKGQLAEARANGATANVEVEIVFPVDSSAVAATDREGMGAGLAELPIVPGVASGEGCSISGGCASCPYMKGAGVQMNSLDALLRVCERVGTPGESFLEAYKPKMFEHIIGGRPVADIGCDPILHMRHFQKNKELSQELVNDILTRRPEAAIK